MKSRDNQFPGRFRISPVKQGLFVLLLSLLFLIGASLSETTSQLKWMITCSGILFFALINPLLGFFSEKWLPYFLRSLLIYVALFLILLKVNTLLSGSSLFSDRSYSMTCLASVIFFFMSSGLILFVKIMYNFISEDR